MLGWLLPVAVNERRVRSVEIRIDADRALASAFDHRLDARRRTAMSRRRNALFVATSRSPADAAEYFRLPRERS
jgi:hypothetical protein